MERNVEIGLLFSIYKNMLTQRQAESVDLYYNEDLSLAEISEHMGITRQGVRDNIKRAEHTMYDVEEKLGLAKRFLTIKEELNRIDDIIRDIEQSPNIMYLSDDIKRKINQILTIIADINEE
ncbi:MAG: DNA-binding protein [Clostridia bacterium]|nr:DNA-binding protein [Clostridia bacterium]